MTPTEEKIARDLLTIGAVFLRPEEPFIWASGIKSPVYCDNRLTLTAPEVRNDVEQALAETVRREYPEAELLMGTSTAGIAHAAITAHLLHLPMGYVRSGAKDHGRGNRIEGKLLPGQKTVVIEDLISTGGSVLEVVEALREAGAEVLGIASIFTYGMEKGLHRLLIPQAGVPQGHQQLMLLALRYLSGGKTDIKQVAVKPAGQRAPQDGQQLFALLLAHQGQRLIKLGENLPFFIDITSPHMGDGALIRLEPAAQLRYFLFIHGPVPPVPGK